MFLKTIIKHHQLIFVMAKRELQSQYVGSFLGFLWTFIQPAVMIVVFWFVFSVGFKAKPLNDVPFVVWLTAGMAPWFIFAAIVTSSTGAVIHQAHLIKKTVFPVQILPVVKIFSSMVGHIAFVSLLIILILFNKMEINIFYFQVLYYLMCLCCLSLGIGFFVSSLNVFIRDIGQIVGVLIQVGFWATPIFWDILIMPEKIQQVLKLNPVYYVVQGYRDSFIYFTPFWERPIYTCYFWVVTCLMFFMGTYVFQKLKPQFADVL